MVQKYKIISDLRNLGIAYFLPFSVKQYKIRILTIERIADALAIINKIIVTF